MCNHLTQLEVRVDTGDLDQDGNFIIDPLQPMSRMLEPISQLSHLTHVTLQNYLLKKQENSDIESCGWFDEEFVVKIIKNMRHLVSIRLDRVDSPDGSYDDDDESEGSIPPLNVSLLAVHLASLQSLKFLNLTTIDGFGSCWSQIKWRGALEGFTLRKTISTLQAIHAFCSMFSDSLVFISLYRNTVYVDNSPLCCTLQSGLHDRFPFQLPNLKRLSICNGHPFLLLNLFRESHNIFRISLMNMSYSRISVKEIASLINRKTSPWLQLKSVLVHVEKDSFDCDEKNEFVGGW
jgi:hypothetical protein